MAEKPAESDGGGMVDVQHVVVTRVDRRVVYAILVCFLSCVLVAGATLLYVTHSNNAAVARADMAAARADRSARNFCDLMQTLDSSYSAQPPSTATGRLVANEIHALVVKLGCVPGHETN